MVGTSLLIRPGKLRAVGIPALPPGTSARSPGSALCHPTQEGQPRLRAGPGPTRTPSPGLRNREALQGPEAGGRGSWRSLCQVLALASGAQPSGVRRP